MREGEWRIVTVKPGGYDSPIGHRPPPIHFDISGRRHRNVAQLYFPEELATPSTRSTGRSGTRRRVRSRRGTRRTRPLFLDVVMMEG